MKKNNVVLLIILIVLILLILKYFEVGNSGGVYAAENNGSILDVQLIARAINGEARGEPYEGQVAVRGSYIKQSKTFKFSKFNSRSNI